MRYANYSKVSFGYQKVTHIYNILFLKPNYSPVLPVFYFTHFTNFKENKNIDYIYDFAPKETRNFINLLAENKSDFLYKLQELFNTASACQDLIQYADNHSIEYRLINSNNYDDGNED